MFNGQKEKSGFKPLSQQEILFWVHELGSVDRHVDEMFVPESQIKRPEIKPKKIHSSPIIEKS